jgi:uncharacterized protein YhjY with autotransporter beta-barrel domain
MKPKHVRSRSLALPSLVVLSALTQFTLAAVISPGLDGNRIVTAADNGANTVVANGGTDLTPTITIQNGVILTGDPAFQNAIRINVANYTVSNAGSLSGATNGIVALNNLTLTNDALAQISGTTGGINVGSGAIITNDGTILSTGGVAVLMGANANLSNVGLIQGSQGITATNGSLITNSGTIRATALGGNAFLGGLGIDNLVLNQDSSVIGNVIGGGGLADSIVFNGGLSAPLGASNSIRGNVTGFNTITKGINGGVAFLGTVADVGGGLNVTANTIQINGGGLYINANVAGSTAPLATINANGAAVGGTGTWSANLNVLSGGLSAGAIPINLDAVPTNSVGRLAVNGSVTHSPGTFIRVDVIPDTPINPGVNSDLIEHLQVAGGSYDVSGAGIRLSPTDINRVITPGDYTIIDSDVPILGAGLLGPVGVQFNNNIGETGVYSATGGGANYLNSVLTQYFVTTAVTNAGTNLELGINYDFSALPGLSPNQSAIGGALDNLAAQAGPGTLGAAEQDLVAALALSDLGAVQATLAALNPDASLAFGASIVNSNYRLHRMVQDHLAFTRNSSEMESYTPGSTTMDAKGGMIQSQPVRRSSSMNCGNVWGSLSYDWQDYEGSAPQADFDGEVSAITVGVDFRVSPTLLIGALIDGSKGDLDQSQGGGADVDSLRGALYGSYGESLGVYADFLVGYGTHEFDRSGSNGGGVIPGFNNSNIDAESLQAMLTVGYAMGNEEVTHGPFVGVEYQQVDVDRFSQGGGPVLVNVSDHEIDSLRGLAGYRVNGNYGAFRPYASVAYAHEFEDGANSASASLGGAAFSVEGAELHSSILVTAGFGYAFSENVMMDLGYRGDLSTSNDGISSHGVSLGLNYGF